MHCNGQCYLKKKMQQAGEKEQLPANPIREKTEFQFFVIEDFRVELLSSASLVHQNTRYLEGSTALHAGSKFRPPALS